MDAIAIISPKGERLFDVVVTPEAVEHEELMQSHYIQLAWTDKTCDILRAGSYITYNGIRYTLLEPYQPQHRDELFYEYKPRFTAEEYTWRKHPFFLVTENERGQAISFEPSWTLTSSADQFMECISKAIKLQTGEAWSVITESKYEVETTTLTFDNTDILSALNAIANAFKTEWWIDRAAHAIHLSEARYMKPTGIVDLRVGQNVTMPSISDSKDEFYNRYYAFGSSRNITQDTQLASANTITQKRLTLDPVKYPNGYIDLEDNPAHVYSKIIYFDDIYPKADLRVGELQKVRKYKRTSQSDESKIVIGTTADGQPIFDTYAVWYFSLPNFTFNNSTYSTDNPNGNLLPGLTLSVNFKSGSLRGREFELSYIDKAITVTDEVSGSKVNIPSAWYCIKFVEQNGYVIPAAEDLIPKTGDEVTLFNIHLPQSYVSSAQTKLEEALRTYIGEFDQDTATYEVQSFATAFADHDPMLSVGALVTLDRTMGGTLLSRVKRIERRLDLPYIQTITIGNNLAKGTIGNLREDLRQAEADLKRLYVATEATQQAVREAPRRYNDIRETTQMLQDALLEGFTEGISPLSVQTMQQIVGSEALQYRFVKSWNASTYEETQPSIYYDKTARTLTIGTSRIQHMTLGITTVTSGTVAPTDTLRWNVSPFTSSSLTEPSQPYYLYARVNRYTDRSQIGTGSFRLEATAHALKEEANYYWLLVGFLNTETSGDRSFATMYGYTEILPGRITTDRIAASNGKLIIDLSTATIYAETLETKGLDEAPTNVSERFKAVDTEVTKANSTATAAQTAADNAKTAADEALNKYANIRVGGQNLALSVSAATIGGGLDGSYNNNGYTTFNKTTDIFHIKATALNNGCYYRFKGEKKEYTFSVDVKGSGKIKFYSEQGGAVQTFDITDTWTRITRTATLTPNPNNGLITICFYSDGASLVDADFTHFQIEEGNIATAWTPSLKEIKVNVDDTITSVDVEYALSTSQTTAPTTGWQTTAPAWASGKYMWQRTKKTTKAGTTTTSNPTCIQGAAGQDGQDGKDGTNGKDGQTGATGKGIKSVIEQYQLSDSATTAPTGTWTSTVITPIPSGKYLWYRSLITYTDNTTAPTNAVVDNALITANTANNTANSASSTANAANSTATAAQSTANAAQKAVDDIEFGGRNLLRNSAFVDTSYWTKQGAAVIRKSSSLSGCMVIEKVRAGAVFDGMHQIVPFSGKGVLTFKAQVLTANSTWLAIIHFLDSASNMVSQTTILISSTAMTDYKLAFAPTQTTIKQAKVIFCTANNNTIANAQLCVVKPQLENGTKPTAWTPAPEDLEQKLTDLDYLKQTFGSGGANVGTIYLAKALVVHDGSTARNVTSGMDGTADVQSSATPMLWAGSQNFNSRSSAAFRVYANGHVDMNDVSIYGGDEANGSVYVDGEKISISKQGKLLSLSSQSLASLDVDTTIENVEQINLTNPITTAKSYTLNVNTGLAKYSTSVSQQIFTYTFAVTSSFYGYPSVGLKVEWTSLVDSSSIKSKRIYVQNMKGDSEMTGTSGEIGYSNPYTPSAGSDTKSLSFSVTIYAEVEYYGPHNNGSCTFKVTPLARSRFPLTVTTKRIANIIAPNALLMKQDSSHYFGIKCDADDLFKASNGNFTLKFNKTSGLMQGNRPAVSPLVLVVRVYLDAQGVYTRTILYNPLNKTVAVKRYNNWTGACTVTHNLGVDSYTCSVICEGHSYGFIDAGTKAKNSVTIGTADDNSRNDMAFEISFFQY